MLRLPIGLVIIDSIAGCVRGENADADFMERSKDFLAISLQLKKLSYKHNAAIVTTNHVRQELNYFY